MELIRRLGAAPPALEKEYFIRGTHQGMNGFRKQGGTSGDIGGQKFRRGDRHIRAQGEMSDSLRRLEKKKSTVTLLFGAKDEKRNNAAVFVKKLRR